MRGDIQPRCSSPASHVAYGPDHPFFPPLKCTEVVPSSEERSLSLIPHSPARTPVAGSCGRCLFSGTHVVSLGENYALYLARFQEGAARGNGGYKHTIKDSRISSRLDCRNLLVKAFEGNTATGEKHLPRASNVAVKPDESDALVEQFVDPGEGRGWKAPIERGSRMMLAQLCYESCTISVPHSFQFWMRPTTWIAFQIVIRKGVLAREITAEGTLSSCRYSGQQDYDFFQELRMGNDSGLVIFSALFALVAIVVLPFLTAAR
jgi:hypothetical protein